MLPQLGPRSVTEPMTFHFMSSLNVVRFWQHDWTRIPGLVYSSVPWGGRPVLGLCPACTWAGPELLQSEQMLKPYTVRSSQSSSCRGLRCILSDVTGWRASWHRELSGFSLRSTSCSEGASCNRSTSTSVTVSTPTVVYMPLFYSLSHLQLLYAMCLN